VFVRFSWPMVLCGADVDGGIAQLASPGATCKNAETAGCPGFLKFARLKKLKGSASKHPVSIRNEILALTLRQSAFQRCLPMSIQCTYPLHDSACSENTGVFRHFVIKVGGIRSWGV
jgi:hypothetical protein